MLPPSYAPPGLFSNSAGLTPLPPGSNSGGSLKNQRRGVMGPVRGGRVAPPPSSLSALWPVGVLPQQWQRDGQESVRQAGHQEGRLLSLGGCQDGGGGEGCQPLLPGQGRPCHSPASQCSPNHQQESYSPHAGKSGLGEGREANVRKKRGDPKGPSPPPRPLSAGLLSSGHSELSDSG